MGNMRHEINCDSEGGLYRDIKEGTIYPPQMGYSEFTTPTSSIGFDTETFSELFFSSSSDEDEDPSSDNLLSPETPGILYKISRQLDKVPKYFCSKRKVEERREEFLDMPEETEGLIQLQASVESMIDQINEEELSMFPMKTEEGELPCDDLLDDVTQSGVVDYDPVRSLSAIESQISELIEQVEKEEEKMMKQLKDNEEKLSVFSHYCRLHTESDSSDSSDEETHVPQVRLSVGRRFGASTIDIRSSGGTLKRRSINRSLPNMYQQALYPPFLPLDHTSSIEYITPQKGVGFVNSGYCIWTSDEDLLKGKVAGMFCFYRLIISSE